MRSPETAVQAAERLGYRLARRQIKLFTWWCDLYPPSKLEIENDNAAKDLTYHPKPLFENVPCYKIESQESNQASPIGRGNYDIMMTTDQFKFAAGQGIEDGWLIYLYPPVGVAEDRSGVQCYIVQGGAQDKPKTGIRDTNQRKVYAIKTPTPKSIGGLP